MTKEQKKLLLKDLCARLYYGVKVRYSTYEGFITCTLQSINPTYNTVDLWSKIACFNSVSIHKIKPYLFPMSSMTEEQRDIYSKLWWNAKGVNMAMHAIDFFNKHHFDYRGLIEKGLALDATNLGIYE